MRQILLIVLGLSIVANAEITKSGNIVTDSVTSLQWQDDTVDGAGSLSSAIAHCEELELDGYSDWRVPNINELKTIIDRSKYYPAIVEGFENTSSNYYWSSTTYEGSKDNMWYVHFEDGRVGTEWKQDDFSKNGVDIRCVRDGQ